MRFIAGRSNGIALVYFNRFGFGRTGRLATSGIRRFINTESKRLPGRNLEEKKCKLGNTAKVDEPYFDF